MKIGKIKINVAVNVLNQEEYLSLTGMQNPNGNIATILNGDPERVTLFLYDEQPQRILSYSASFDAVRGLVHNSRDRTPYYRIKGELEDILTAINNEEQGKLDDPNLSLSSRSTSSRIIKTYLEDFSYIDHPSFSDKAYEDRLFKTCDLLRIQYEGKKQKKVLSREEEVELFLAYNGTKHFLKKYLTRVQKRGCSERTIQKIIYFSRAEHDLKAILTQANIPLVLALAKIASKPNVEFSDLVSEGNQALLRSIDGYDASRGFKFSTYASRGVLQAFGRHASKTYRHQNRFPTEFDPDYEKSDHIETSRQEDKEMQMETLNKILDNNLAELTDIELGIVRNRFGFSGPKRTLVQEGERLGLTKERIRQIQKKAVRKLGDVLEESIN